MKKIALYILILVALVPDFTFAQYKLLEPLPCIPDTGNNCKQENCAEGSICKINLDTYIGYVFKFSIALAAFLAVIMIIWGGFEVMLSESPFKIGNGKDRIWNAIIGLVMVLASYLILETIDPRLVQINTTIPTVEVKDLAKDGSSLLSTISEDINKLNTADKEKVEKLQKQNIGVQESIDMIQKIAAEENRPLTQEEKANIENFKQEIKSNEAEITSKIYRSESSKSFSDTINFLRDEKNYKTVYVSTNISERGDLLETSEVKLEKNISEIDYAEEYKKLKDAGNIAEAEKVKIRGDFYKRQIAKEKELMKNVLISQGTIDRAVGFTKSKEADLYLKTELKALSTGKEIDSTIKNDPELVSEYEAIKQRRLELLKTVIK